MGEETVAAPNWLGELEAKREKRVKARLGHEAGAGAPCLTCQEKCPGLDLHFWRKICKNCKCAKESHDVHDDDIYGWAQFQLLGSKPNKIKTKIVLPGKKDEVELDWTPKGPAETVDRYLKTLPPESLPVKGSQAAQTRKQLLQKQIPIHDIDPGLCHDLTDAELLKMNDYIEHMKTNSVGVGQIIQLGGLCYNSSFVSGQHPPPTEPLSHQFENLAVGQTSNYLPNSSKITTTNQEPLKLGGIRDIHYPYNQELNEFFDKIPNPINMTTFGENNANLAPRNLPHYAPGRYNVYNNEQTPSSVGSIRDLAFSTYDPSVRSDVINSNYKGLQAYQPTNRNVGSENLVPNQVTIGAIHDINYDVEYPEVKSAVLRDNRVPDELPAIVANSNSGKSCRKCRKIFAENEFAVLVERSDALYHSDCFKCTGCNQSLADMVYFYDKESDNIYCGRDFAKIRGIPRCKACDELIFVKEYCLAENSTFHVKHFCCFECDKALAGQNYVVEDSQPLCLPCFEQVKANRCEGCGSVIKPNEQGANLNGVHFHATDDCFACKICKKPLLKAKILLKNRKLYCSHDCHGRDQ